MRPAPLLAAVALATPLLASAPRAPHGDVRINELLAVNDGGLLDEDGDDSDWIEIWNTGAVAVDLAGWHLTDDAADLTKWTFPSHVLQPGEFLVVFASDKDRAVPGSELHTNFRLTSAGEFLALVGVDGFTVESAYAPAFPEQVANQSWGVKDSTLDEGYFDPVTPGAPNGDVFAALVPALFSVERGFHDVPFDLVLSHPVNQVAIRYTTDGSSPDFPNGAVYNSPIPISTTTIVRAKVAKTGFKPSKRVAHTYLFADDVLQQTHAGAIADGFPADWIEEDGTNWDLGGGRPGAWYGFDTTIFAAYTNTELVDALKSIPSVSLSMSIDDWFADGSSGPISGIYPNSERAGRDWDRAGSMEWIDPSGGEELQVNCGLAIQGGSSTTPAFRNQLSIALKFQKEFGPGKLRFAAFPESDVEEFDYLVLDAGNQNAPNGVGDLSKKLHAQGLRDQFMSDLHLAMNGLSPSGTYVHLYLNGLYWGVFNLHERIDHRGASAHQGGEPEEYDYIKENAVRFGNTNDWDHPTAPGAWDSATTIAANGLTPGDTWQGQPAYDEIRKWFDVADYADYLLLNYYGGNTDWPQNNWVGTNHARLSADFADLNLTGSKWRWHSWDAETVLWWGGAETAVGDGFWDRTSEASTWSGSISYFYTYLRANPEWRVLIADRAHQHLFHGTMFVDDDHDDPGTPFDPAHPERNRPAALYHRLATQVETAIVMEYARWGNYWHSPSFITPADWVVERDRILEEFCAIRSDVLLAQLRNVQPQLYPDLDAPAFSQYGGSIGKNKELSMSGPAGATIWYTLDGRDPRQVGGAVTPTALAYSAPFVLPGPTVSVRARAFDGSEWSALEKADFAVGVKVVINELQARNRTTILDELGQSEDWVELFNKGDVAVDVSGWGLSDNPNTPGEWHIPNGTVLPPKGYLVIWLDDDELDGPMHATFKLDGDGDEILLSGPKATGHVPIDFVEFGRQTPDASYGRLPNGKGPFTTSAQPTPGSANFQASRGAQ